MCVGIRIVRALSARARATAWRIHQVASVENLKPLRWSNFSAARTRPIVPSWIRSRKGRPWLRYFLAIETTRRRLASTISCLARCSPRSIRFASSTSCAAVSRSTLPMSFRKSCSESVVTSRGSSGPGAGPAKALWIPAWFALEGTLLPSSALHPRGNPVGSNANSRANGDARCATQESNRLRSKPAQTCFPASFGQSGPCSERDRVLALDDVFDLERLRLARKLDPYVLQHRHEALAERVELLS